MRGIYRGYYEINAPELDDLWSDGLIVVDTNVLLGLYSQSITTRKAMTDALGRKKRQLWLPHQVGLEYHRNRESARDDASAMHRQLTNKIRTDRDAIRRLLVGLERADPQLAADKLLTDFDAASDSLMEKITEAKKRLDDDRKGPDQVLAAVEKLYSSGNVGAPFSSDALSRHRQLGAERTAAQQPPGYADAKDKSGDRVYGDYFLWAQLLDYAEAEARDVILVTDDEKADWRASKGVARPELLDEFHARTRKLIRIYNSQDFLLEESKRHNKSRKASAAATRAAEEIKDISANELTERHAGESLRSWLSNERIYAWPSVGSQGSSSATLPAYRNMELFTEAFERSSRPHLTERIDPALLRAVVLESGSIEAFAERVGRGEIAIADLSGDPEAASRREETAFGLPESLDGSVGGSESRE